LDRDRVSANEEYTISSFELLRCTPGDATTTPEVIASFRAVQNVPLRNMFSIEELARILVSGDAVTRFTNGTIVPSARWDEALNTFAIHCWLRSGPFSFPSVSSLLARLRDDAWHLGEHVGWFLPWWQEEQEMDRFWKLYSEHERLPDR
jgi:hypothetical protein